LGLALLPAEALDVNDGQAEHLDLVEGLLDGLELLRLDDRQDQFHGLLSVVSCRSPDCCTKHRGPRTTDFPSAMRCLRKPYLGSFSSSRTRVWRLVTASMRCRLILSALSRS